MSSKASSSNGYLTSRALTNDPSLINDSELESPGGMTNEVLIPKDPETTPVITTPAPTPTPEPIVTMPTFCSKRQRASRY